VAEQQEHEPTQSASADDSTPVESPDVDGETAPESGAYDAWAPIPPRFIFKGPFRRHQQDEAASDATDDVSPGDNPQ
jgi:hypothetical protein